MFIFAQDWRKNSLLLRAGLFCVVPPRLNDTGSDHLLVAPKPLDAGLLRDMMLNGESEDDLKNVLVRRNRSDQPMGVMLAILPPSL